MPEPLKLIVPPLNMPALVAELVKIYPDCARHMLPQPRQYNDGITLAFEQSAWCDISFGWESHNECPPQTNCNLPEYRPCPLGGRFFRSAYSIGD